MSSSFVYHCRCWCGAPPVVSRRFVAWRDRSISPDRNGAVRHSNVSRPTPRALGKGLIEWVP
jgi:hypothetical protein